MKFYKNEKELTKLFYSSAENIDRNHPLQYVKQKKQSEFKKYLIGKKNILNNFTQKIANFFIEKQEKSFYKKNNYHSERAVKEYLEYYENLYFSKSPDFEKLKILLKRNGSPDIPNPYKLGQENFFKYNEFGLMAAEIEVILNHIISNMNKINHETDNTENNEKVIISDILKHFEDSKRKERENKEIFYQKAMQAWAIIAIYGNGCDFIKTNIDEENIYVVTMEVILNVNYVEIDENIENIVRHFYEKKYIEENIAKSLLLKRLNIEKEM